jgi:hypothetical protein
MQDLIPPEAVEVLREFVTSPGTVITISGLHTLANHVEYVLERDRFDLEEIDGLEEVVFGQLHIHERYVRQQLLAECTPKQRETLEQVEARVRKVHEAVSEAFQGRLEQRRRDARRESSEVTYLEDKRRAHEARVARIAHIEWADTGGT